MTSWRIIPYFCLLILFLATDDRTRSQDRATAIPDMKVLLQNEHVRVQFHDVKVGETTAMHSHPAYVANVFNEYTGRAILADGTEVPLGEKLEMYSTAVRLLIRL